MLNNAFRSAYDLAFQVSPIILTGGIVANAPGGLMPVIGLTGQLTSFVQGLTSGLGISDSFYARFLPIPGSTVINNAVGMYPFANQQVAANAIIEQPKNISLLMIAPVRDASGYLTKLATFSALQASFQNHNNAGGTYTIATPAYMYTNCIMTAMTDVTTGDTKQRQVQWQIDFIKPLVSMQAASAAYNNQLAKIAGGQQLNSPFPSGLNGGFNSPGIAGAINGFMGSPL